jgi:hypothetical protein
MKTWHGPRPLTQTLAVPGFLTYHRTSRHYIMITKLQNILDTWRTSNGFSRFCELIAELPVEEPSIMDKLPDKFLKTAMK